MSLHVFTVGQRVAFSPGRGNGTAQPGVYTIVRLLPNDGSDREYRVKSVDDGHERVVRESELSRTASAPDTEGRRVFARMTGTPKP
jgi:hypothetical protein